MKKVALCVPARDKIHVDFFQSYIEIYEYLLKSYNTKCFISDGFPVDAARNELVRSAAIWGAEYFLFIDSDVSLHPVEKIDKLFTFLDENNNSFVAGLYFSKSYPFMPVIRRIDRAGMFVQDERVCDAPYEVDGTGFGLVLIKREEMAKVINETKGNCFSYKKDEISEDLYFCKTAKKLGISVFVHPDVDLVHHGGAVDYRQFLQVKDNTINGFVELAEYLQKPVPFVKQMCVAGARMVMDDWKNSNPKTEEEVTQFYVNNRNYIYNLTFWWLQNQIQRENILFYIQKLANNGVSAKQKHVLDYGCGIGDYGIWFSEHCSASVDFFDINQVNLRYLSWRIAKRKLNECRIYDNAQDLKGKYNYVICMDVIEHVPRPQEHVDRIKSLLSESGTLIAQISPKKESQPQHISEFDLEKNGFEKIGYCMFKKVS